MRTRGEWLKSFDALLSAGTLDAYGRWIVLIERLRVEHDISILEAERIALSNPALKRWVEKQITQNSNAVSKRSLTFGTTARTR